MKYNCYFDTNLWLAGEYILQNDGQTTSLDLRDIQSPPPDLPTPTPPIRRRPKRKQTYQRPPSKRKPKTKATSLKHETSFSPSLQNDTNDSEAQLMDTGRHASGIADVTREENSSAKVPTPQEDEICQITLDENPQFNNIPPENNIQTANQEPEELIRLDLPEKSDNDITITSLKPNTSDDVSPDNIPEDEELDLDESQPDKNDVAEDKGRDIRSHVSIPSSMKHPCGLCGKLFLLESTMMRHIRRVHSLTMAGYQAALDTAPPPPCTGM
jgi:hypothetical protein